MFHAGVYIGWVGYLNLGDEILYDLCQARYRSISWSVFDTLDYTARPSRLMNTFENYCRTIEPLLLEPVLDLGFASHPPDPVR